MEPSKTHFALLLDKDRDRCLNVMMQATMKDERAQQFIIRIGLADTFRNLIGEIADKTHELGWCEDPRCDHNETK